MLVDLTGAILSKEDAPVCKTAKIVPLGALAFAGGLDLKPLVIDGDSGGQRMRTSSAMSPFVNADGTICGLKCGPKP